MTHVNTHDSTALDIRDVSIDYGRGKRRKRAVHGVSLKVGVGETVALVGESGSGKTSLAMAALGLTPIAEGSITVNGKAINPKDRGGVIDAGAQAVFQSPYSSLDPAMPISAILAESVVHLKLPRREIAVRSRAILDEVGIPPTAMDRYPREFSGGQRQRIAIARAMMPRPRLIVCDEPTSALDLSIQAQVVNLLLDLQKSHGISYLVISHDLALMKHLATRMYVMLRGRIVEEGPAQDLYDAPVNSYTRALINAAPLPNPAAQRLRRAENAAARITV